MNRHATIPGLLRSTPLWLRVHGLVCYAFLYLPVAVLLVYSFSASRYAGMWSGFTFSWYGEVFENARIMQALRNSTLLALAATITGAALGTLAALGHARLTGLRGQAAETSLILPLMVPDIVIALALRLWFVKVLEVTPGMATMIAGHTVLSTCYVFMVVSTRLRGFDWRLMEAAGDLGASRWQAFRHVLLPLIWPGVAGGALLSLAVSMDEYVITTFLSGPGNGTLPVEVAGMIRKGFSPQLNALAVLMLLTSVLLALLAVFIQRRGRTLAGSTV